MSARGAGLVLVRKPVAGAARAVAMPAVREATTGCVVLLPRVWAVAEQGGTEEATPRLKPLQLVATRLESKTATPERSDSTNPARSDSTSPARSDSANPERSWAATPAQPEVELAFYRKYTEAMLRRYLRLSMQCGRVPSLLGRELFRGNVTRYPMHTFEDSVIFCHDMEKRLERLEGIDRQLIKRIGLQQYSQGEAAGVLGISLRHTTRLYGVALDRLTAMLLEDRLLEPLKSCQ